MRAWRFHEFGDIANYQIEDVPDPAPRPGEVTVRLQYAALNPADRLLIEGRYPGAGELPLTVGRDGAGTVERGSGNGAYAEGDRVVILRSEIGITRQGTLAEKVAAPEDVLAPVPEGWSMEEAAAAPLVYLTAWKALVDQGGLQTGETVLVTGASGGVGIASIQLAKCLGARVIALSRDEAKRERLVELGADHALDDGADGLGDRVCAIASGGVDLVIEHLGGPRLAEHLGLLTVGGRIMVIGLLAGRTAEVDLGAVLFKQARIEGVHVGKYTPGQARHTWDRVVATLDTANARPVIDTVFDMRDVQDAFAYLKGGHMGKVLVKVGPTGPAG